MNKALWATIFKHGMNLWPCFRGTGGRVASIDPDFHRILIKIPMNWRTRNRVGTVFGGSMYAATDPFFMLMLMEILGKNFVVWDKGATIRFRRPATVDLYAEFVVGPQREAEVRKAISEGNETTFTWTIQLKDSAGTVYAEIDKVLYAADKAFYKEKLGKRREAKNLKVNP
jgi:acyl-coenzyme A thioesterase PaaI-like protein